MARHRTQHEIEWDRAYDSRPDQKKKRAARNKARREALRKGLVHKGDDKDVDHIVPLGRGGSTDTSNTRVVSAKKNRGWKKGKSGYNV